MPRPGLALRVALNIPEARESVRPVVHDPGMELDNGCSCPISSRLPVLVLSSAEFTDTFNACGTFGQIMQVQYSISTQSVDDSK